MSHPYAESRKRARKKWRQSPKGKAWDKAYLQRPDTNIFADVDDGVIDVSHTVPLALFTSVKEVDCNA